MSSASFPTVTQSSVSSEVLCEQNDEWSVARRYMSIDSLAKASVVVIDGDATDDQEGVMKNSRRRAKLAKYADDAVVSYTTSAGGTAFPGQM